MATNLDNDYIYKCLCMSRAKKDTSTSKDALRKEKEEDHQFHKKSNDDGHSSGSSSSSSHQPTKTSQSSGDGLVCLEGIYYNTILTSLKSEEDKGEESSSGESGGESRSSSGTLSGEEESSSSSSSDSDCFQEGGRYFHFETTPISTEEDPSPPCLEVVEEEEEGETLEREVSLKKKNKTNFRRLSSVERKSLRKLRKKMLRKLNCGRCLDARSCCDIDDEDGICSGVANDEQTNGVKILRRKDPPVDLAAELASITNRAVSARLKLILDKLDNGQLEAISPQVLKKNLTYALTLIQGGSGPGGGEQGSLDRRSSSEETENDTLSPLPILSVLPPPQPTSTSTSSSSSSSTVVPSIITPCIITSSESSESSSSQVQQQQAEQQQSASSSSPPSESTTTKPQLLAVEEGSERKEESDNELSEVDEEVIPEEVRKWLASTFTKSVVSKPRTEPRPRFRSVANAIRVGLFVDRFYRQLSSNTLEIPADLQQLLKEINNWHFDIFKLQEKSTGHSLKFVAKELFSRYGLVSRFRVNLDKLDSFLGSVEFGYTKLKNPYHNDIHAADVTQTLHYFIGSSGIANNLTDLEIFALLFAALIHDLEHTGRTNNFHVNTQTDMALLYNDRSVLENHHVSAAFRLLREEEKNILANLKPEEFREFRSLVIEMVLFTDMSTHFAQIKHVRALLQGDKSAPSVTMSLMSLLLHAADISHPGKPWRLHKKFADTILEEFFMQGDEEAKLGLPFSPLCDRNTVLVPESQISFIEFIVEPSLSILSDLIDYFLSSNETQQNTNDKNKSKVIIPPTKTTVRPFQQTSKTPNPESEDKKSPSSSSSNRRTESENNIKTDKEESGSHSAGGKTLTSRTTSFPLQTSAMANHTNAGTFLRPWLNHLVENKAKWRMIAAERENAKARLLDSPTTAGTEGPPVVVSPPSAEEEAAVVVEEH